MSKLSLMTVCAHCDDIEINFAGTMLKYHEQFGYDIQYVLSTNNMAGIWSEPTRGPRAGLSQMPDWVMPRKTLWVTDDLIGRRVPWYHEMTQRKIEAANAARDCFHTVPIHLDYAQRHYFDRNLNKVDLRYGAPAPDCYDPSVPTIMTACDDPVQIERVAQLILEKNPEVILTHCVADYTFEHSGTTLLVNRAFQKAQQEGYDGSLLCAARPGRNNLGRYFDRWDAFIDTTGYLEQKKEAIGKHVCQIPLLEPLKLFDPYAAQICGIGETIEPYVVVHLSKKREGPLTEELTKNHSFCNENWMTLFFSPETEKAHAAFIVECQRQDQAAAKPITDKATT